ncbi:TRAP transporter substrate-binding protein [Sedimentibacter hydroxybenzoicus DSM 7310]|uniref:TRAP transporter substrate-binding protein n=1 Tax=Sedimentibacter hydroxybenzoicus DSM 7310 TaxID=1123245 RepID=A0A974BKS4_SEDHY|nr:TRAP transporter substrate-binding protein [Sedimentibacter hydroxybenzoicus]NYB74681.1 TRAP transporter substrate-binding protein [Sedimentibacter hydroxybenzoicus DSM 7310]
MKKGLSLLLVLVFVVVSLAGCSSGSASKTGEPVKSVEKQIWKVSLMGSETHPVSQGFKIFKEELESRVGDQVEVQLYYNGQLGTSPDQTIGGMQNKIIHFSDIALGNVVEYSKAFIPLDVPYLLLNRDTALALVDSEVGKEMAAKYEEDTKVKLLGVWDFGYRVITNNVRPIKESADFKGLKIRTLSNNLHLKAFEIFGAVPTTMPYSEVFTGLQQGTIDGQENPLGTIYDSKFHEVQKYLSLTNHVYGFLGMHMSADLYNSQSDEVKKAIDESAAIAIEKEREICKKINDEALQKIKDDGTTVNEVSEKTMLELRDMMAPVIDMASGIVGEDYMNKVINEIKKIEGN